MSNTYNDRSAAAWPLLGLNYNKDEHFVVCLLVKPLITGYHYSSRFQVVRKQIVPNNHYFQSDFPNFKKPLLTTPNNQVRLVICSEVPTQSLLYSLCCNLYTAPTLQNPAKVSLGLSLVEVKKRLTSKL